MTGLLKVTNSALIGNDKCFLLIERFHKLIRMYFWYQYIFRSAPMLCSKSVIELPVGHLSLTFLGIKSKFNILFRRTCILRGRYVGWSTQWTLGKSARKSQSTSGLYENQISSRHQKSYPKQFLIMISLWHSLKPPPNGTCLPIHV